MWSDGIVYGLPIGILVIIVGLLPLYRWHKEKDRWKKINHSVLAMLGSIFAGISVVFLLVGLFPYDSEYHKWRIYDFPVANVEQVQLSGDGARTAYILEDITGDRFICDDAQCATIDVGQRAHLLCIPRYYRYRPDPLICKIG